MQLRIKKKIKKVSWTKGNAIKIKKNTNLLFFADSGPRENKREDKLM